MKGIEAGSKGGSDSFLPPLLTRELQIGVARCKRQMLRRAPAKNSNVIDQKFDGLLHYQTSRKGTPENVDRSK